MYLQCFFQSDEETEPGEGHSSSTAFCNSEGNLWFRFVPDCQNSRRKRSWIADGSVGMQLCLPRARVALWVTAAGDMGCPVPAAPMHSTRCQHRLAFASFFTAVREVWDGLPHPVRSQGAGTKLCRDSMLQEWEGAKLLTWRIWTHQGG